ncbi:hypothetical protein TWF718_001640 [Orbilia javanica]|uniref:Gamma-glutamylcyclotransferase AIG2-like domain-containing protein n=1 Tax=Orbilia javanica TaxID=47235 RepID=A0AAN8RNE3_9PEZI
MTNQSAQSTEALDSNFKPSLLFCYGIDKTPSFLKRILRLREDPILTPAEIIGYRLKLWGPHPALVSCEDSTPENPSIVKGVTYRVTTEAQLQRLKTYQGTNYIIEPLAIYEISSETGEKAEKQGGAFVWNSLPHLLRDWGNNP